MAGKSRRKLTGASRSRGKSRQRALTAVDLAAGACFVASGFLALTYEICWIRKASLVFGAATFALSTVLAVFFAALAIGSYTFGRYSSRTRRPLRLYGLLEMGAGALVLVSPVAFVAADSVYGWFYPRIVDSFALLSLVRFVLVALILLPPVVLMGGTLPLFCRHYVRSRAGISRSVGLLYGLNTLGAAAGCAACGLVMIPHIGVNTTLYLGGALNVLIGAVVWLLPTGEVPLPAEAADSQEPAPIDREVVESSPAGRRSTTVIACLFFLAGFVALGHEILWARYLSLLMRNTVYTYTFTLLAILIGIVLGSFVVVLGSFLPAKFFDLSRHRALLFGAVQVAIGVTVMAVLMSPASFWSHLTARVDVKSTGAQMGMVILVLLVPAVLSGMSFPLAIRMAVDQPAKAGSGVGWMTALNTLGGITGSLLVGFFVLPFFGLQKTLLATTLISLLIGFAAWLLLEPSVKLWVRSALIVLSTALWLWIPNAAGTRLPEDFLAGRGELLDFREGLGSHMAVLDQGSRIVLEIDGLPQGHNIKTLQIMAAHYPMLLHPDPKRVLVVGLGPGQTASRFAMYPIEQLDCVEIERELVPLVKRHFDSAWMDDERVRFIVEDGRNYLAHTDASYDVISIEVGPVFRPGLASFYTAEFYRVAHRRLRPRGLLCQFLPIGFFTNDELRTLVATFLQEFPHSSLWFNGMELLLIGTADGELKVHADRLDAVTSQPELREDLDYAYWGGPRNRLYRKEVLLAGFLAGPEGLAKLADGAPIYRDDLPYLEYTTSRLRGSFSAIPAVKLLLENLDPVQPLLDWSLDQQAVAEIRSIQEKNLGNIAADYFVGFANLYRAGQRQKQMVQMLREALAWNDDSFKANAALALELERQGELRAAIHYYQRAQSLHPDDDVVRDGLSHVHYRRGNAARSAGRHDTSIAHFRAALSLNSEFVQAHNNLAGVLRLKGQRSESIQHYRQALQLKPDFAEAHYNLGTVLDEVGQNEAAVEHLSEALRLQPDNAEMRENLDRVQRSLGEEQDRGNR